MSKELTRELVAEFMGVLGLVYFGGWSVLLAVSGKIDMLGVAMVHSGVLGVFIWAGAAYGGCHFNPALTIGFLCINAISAKKAFMYIIAQFIGSVVSAIGLLYTCPRILLDAAKAAGADLGAPHQNNDFNWFTSSFLEFLGTFILMFTVKSLAHEGKAGMFAPVIGFAVGLCIMCFGSFTGTAVNPFRYLGPAIFANRLNDFYIYTIPPIIGATVAAYTYEAMFDFSDDIPLEAPLK